MIEMIYSIGLHSKSFVKRNLLPLFVAGFVVLCSFFGTILFQSITNGTESDVYQKVVYEDKEVTQVDEEISWADIFIHNFIILFPAILGILSFGFISFWYLILQGYLLGVSIFTVSQHLPLGTVLKYTVPHGIFEILAIIFLGAFAFKPSIVILSHFLFNKPFMNKRDFHDITILFALFVIFLFIAALVEGLITPNL
ncbi:stage II sporulation protein M [Caldalkalibacillus mannanilyticus]|uniref:stage II sporulation protein M n=1 Tax=Caldalkalibacillus mannanilyticus TaxID=1418 RepID=UPI000468B2B0|nr:stage II sporulation protein M [Caldalkalibacillus mannanilyticus]